MDDHSSQFMIPGQKTGQEQPQPTAPESAGFQSADIVAMGDMLEGGVYDQEAYYKALTDSEKRSTHPQTIRAMVQEVQPQIEHQHETQEFNEWDIKKTRNNARKLTDNLVQWRRSEASASDGNDENLQRVA